MVKRISISEAKLQRRQEAKETIPGSSTSAREYRKYRANVEERARTLLIKWNQEGRPEAAIKGDLIEFYTKNYYPEKHVEIEALIEQLRTIPGSGHTTELTAELKKRQREWDSHAHPY